MNTILTILRKELMDTLRDRKTLISAVALPALAMPLLLLGISRLQKSLTDKELTKELKVAVFNAPPEMSQVLQDPKIRIISTGTLQAAKDSVAAERYDAALDFSPGFSAAVDSLQAGQLSLYYKSTNILVERRVTGKLDQYKAAVMSDRFKRLNLSEDLLEPVRITNIDMASKKEQIGVLLGGILPYIFIIFCFFGCMYPAIDLTTGEKEKGTLETLLTVPASRFQILIGKMLAIATVGVCAAFMTIGGMFVAVRLSSEIPPEILKTITDILSVRFVIMLFAMLIPLSLFFAGLLSAISIRASSFKEAQSYVTPLTFVVIVPAMIALMPGVKLSWENVWVPILNIALATKEIIAGTISTAHYAAIVLSLVAFAIITLAISIRQFSKEGNILK